MCQTYLDEFLRVTLECGIEIKTRGADELNRRIIEIGRLYLFTLKYKYPVVECAEYVKHLRMLSRIFTWKSISFTVGLELSICQTPYTRI